MKLVSLNLNEDLSQNVHYEPGEFPVVALEDNGDSQVSVNSPMHWHYELELALVKYGSIVYMVNGQQHLVREGQIIFVRPNALHGTIVGEEDHLMRILLIHPRVFGERETYLKPYIQKIARRAPDAVVLDQTQNWYSELDELCAEIFRLCYEKPDAFELDAEVVLFRLLRLFLKELCAGGTAPAANPVNSSHVRLAKQMMAFVQEHYGEKIGIPDIAGAGGVARNTCNNIFRCILDETPIEYLTEYRICTAMELLRRRNSVTEAAMRCGFNTTSYFSKVFKETTGMTPLEFQKQEA